MYKVYLITNMVSLKIYVGVTCTSLETRWRKHVNAAKNEEKKHLYRAILKYGKGGFVVDCLNEFENIDNAYSREQELIKALKSYNRQVGYNISLGGKGFGRHSEESKRKISEASSGEKSHFYGKPGYMAGKHHTEETKRKIGDTNKISQLGNHLSEETKNKIRIAHKNIKRTPEWCANISRGQKAAGIKRSIAFKEAARQRQLGKKPSSETRAKLSEANRRRWVKVREARNDSSNNRHVSVVS
jgi:group I intron endonuclease